MKKTKSFAILSWLSIMLMAIFLACEPSNDYQIQSEILTGIDAESKFIEDSYIVVYKNVPNERTMPREFDQGQDFMQGATREFLASVGIDGVQVDRVYSHVLNGFSAKLTQEQVLILENNPNIDYIEQDQVMGAFSTTQSGATWGLDRIDQRELPLNQTYLYEANGTAVKAYIIDTGINTSHQEFAGRALQGFDAFGGNSEDCNGHGTHVAGTVGGSVYGVAKNVTLIGVRVLDCNGSGTTTGVIAGMDWVAGNANGPSIANMSLGGGASTAIDDAVAKMYNANIGVIVAAGNGDRRGREQPACNYSPARAANAYTVGATTTTDSKTSWSNYGDCVNIFAPGASITAAWHTSSTAINTISGTSMASPHVAGAAALYLQSNISATPQQVYDFLTSNSTKNIVSNSKTSNNHMLFTLSGNGGGDTGGNDGDTGGNDGDTGVDAIALSGLGSKVSGRWLAELSWSGATSSQVDIFRNGTKIATINNTGSYADQTNFRGGGSLTYEVCEAGSDSCSNSLTLNF